MEISCQFLNPVDLGAKQYPDWEFSELNCQATTTGELTHSLISNSTTGAEFYVEKTMSYGEGILVWFATIFLIFLIADRIFKFFWKR